MGLQKQNSIKQHDISQGKENCNKQPSNGTPAPNANKKVKMDPLRGQSCVSRHSDDGLYYPGIVVKSIDARHVLVKFNQMGKCTVPSRFIIPTGGAVPCPILQIGDYVLVRAVNIETNKECYVPGIVRNTPNREYGHTKFYTVVFYTGQKTTVLRSSLIKISKSRFSFAIRFLKDSYSSTDEDVVFKTEIRPYKHHQTATKHQKRSTENFADSTTNDGLGGLSEQNHPTSTTLSDQSRISEEMNSKANRSDRREVTDPRHLEMLREQQNRLDELQHELELQQRKQERRQKKLHHETRKLAKAQQNFAEEQARRQEQTEKKLLQEHQKLLTKQEEILEKYEENQKKVNESDELNQKLLETGKKSSKKMRDKRMNKWVSDQSSRDNSAIENIIKAESMGKEMSDASQTSRNKNKPKKSKTTERSQKDLDKGKEKMIDESQKASSQPSSLKSEMRHTSQPLKEGDEVLARWSDEGWYYRGTIAKIYKENLYLVEDACNDMEQIWREDIITDEDDMDNVIQIRDTVIALHPHYAFSYAPGVILDVFPDLSLLVRLYDGAESHLPRDEIYKLPPRKFDKDIEYIVQCEEKWVGQAVIARNDDTGVYNLASVKERLSCGSNFVLVWADGSESEQTSSCIFGPFTKRHPLTVGDKVLAVADATTLTYLPGQITSIAENKLSVLFCNGMKGEDFDPLQVFWLSKDFFNIAVAYFKSKENLPAKLQHTFSIDSQPE